MKASVVITTKNRKEELRVALRSAFDQSAQPEVVVMDDGSTDGTAEMVRGEFPKTVLHHFRDSKGYIVRRNEGAQLATGSVIFSIDDDAEFSTAQVVEQVLQEFNHRRIGAVAIPYTEPRKDNVERQRAPETSDIWVADAFIGTAHALRRDIFLKIAGYREHLVHQGEERDFCIRLLSKGHVVRLGTSDSIQHFESPKRDYKRMDYYGRRNDVLFAWQNVPAPWLLIHLAATTVNGLRSAFAVRRFKEMSRGIFQGYGDCITHRYARVPIPNRIYQLNRRLKKDGPARLADIEEILAPIPKT